MLESVQVVEKQLLDAIEKISEGLAVYDTEDRLVYSNSRYREFLYAGADIDLSPGRHFESILRDAISRGLIEDALSETEAWIARRLNEHRHPSMPIEQRRSGGRWVLVCVQQLTGGGTVTIATDLTEQKQRENELIESQDRLQAILDVAPVHFFMKDIEGRYILSNRAFEDYWNFPAQHVIGKTDYDLYPKETADLFLASDREILTTGLPVHFEDTAEFEGKLRSCVVDKFPLIDRSGQAYAICAVTADITEVREREREIAAMGELRRQAAEEIAQKNSDLAAVSTKLAKYLSPQIYDSIFTGRQEVRLTSQRKKLTVFFSDIVGFTEITDKMESEDLTQLINHYFTEMSQIALAFGATIDKFIGDAIMIFFGDPKTDGVKADALACVNMAIAMQNRMRELAGVWRELGIETPLSCRIGINTGYCTVGNFGSDDRMDYTIIGGAVNLASRLEHESAPGGTLISYETFAHVKDEILCEEVGQIQVKGIAYPISTYRVLGLRTDEVELNRIFKAELPHLKLAADLHKMSPEERNRATTLLMQVIEKLGQSPENNDED